MSGPLQAANAGHGLQRRWLDGRGGEQVRGGSAPWLSVFSRSGRQQKSPRQWQGLKGAMVQTTQRSSGAGGLDAAAQLAAETEGGAGAQDGQGAWDVPEGVFYVIDGATVRCVGVCDGNLSGQNWTRNFIDGAAVGESCSAQ